MCAAVRARVSGEPRAAPPPRRAQRPCTKLQRLAACLIQPGSVCSSSKPLNPEHAVTPAKAMLLVPLQTLRDLGPGVGSLMPAPSRVWSHVCSWASEGAKACARRRLGPSAALTVAWLQALSATKVKGHRPARGTQREWLSPGEGAASLDKCPRGAAGPL